MSTQPRSKPGGRRTWRRATALAVSLTFVAAACGGDDDDGGDGAEPVETEGGATETTAATDATGAATTDAGGAATTAAGGTAATDGTTAAAPANAISDECPIENPADEVQIDLMGWEFPIISQYAAELRECEEGNYSFNIQFLDSTEAQNQITLDLQTGAPSFEVVQGSNDFIVTLAQQDLLMPLNDLIDKYRDEFALDEIDQAFWDLASVDGNIYAIPMVSNTMHVFYNEAVLEELGLEVPTTFEEAIAMCPALEEAGYPGFQLMLSANWSWQIEFDNVLGSMGVEPIDPETGQPNFNSPEGIEAANILADALEQCGGSTAGSYSTDDIQNAFQTGEYVVAQTWASRAQAMDDPEAADPDVLGNVQFAPALSTGGDILAAPAYIDGYAIPNGLDADPEAVFRAILAASDRESQEAAAAFGTVTRTGVTNPDGPRNGEAALTSFVDGRGPESSHPAGQIYRSAIGDALLTILDGTSVEDALAEAETRYLEEAEAQGLL